LINSDKTSSDFDVISKLPLWQDALDHPSNRILFGLLAREAAIQNNSDDVKALLNDFRGFLMDSSLERKFMNLDEAIIEFTQKYKAYTQCLQTSIIPNQPLAHIRRSRDIWWFNLAQTGSVINGFNSDEEKIKLIEDFSRQDPLMFGGKLASPDLPFIWITTYKSLMDQVTSLSAVEDHPSNSIRDLLGLAHHFVSKVNRPGYFLLKFTSQPLDSFYKPTVFHGCRWHFINVRSKSGTGRALWLNANPTKCGPELIEMISFNIGWPTDYNLNYMGPLSKDSPVRSWSRKDYEVYLECLMDPVSIEKNYN